MLHVQSVALKYDPSQPRNPKGSSVGGEFARSKSQPVQAEVVQFQQALLSHVKRTKGEDEDTDSWSDEAWLNKPHVRGSLKQAIWLDLVARLQGHPAFAGVSDENLAEFVQRKLDTWASTSGDSDPEAVGLQEAVDIEFQLQAPMGHMEVVGRPKELARNRAFARAEYERTQAWFKEHGITHVSVFRGMGNDDAMLPSNTGEPENILMQPASSWSTSMETAMSFALDAGAPVMLAMRVPVTDVLSTAATGQGCLPEEELLLLGKSRRAWVFEATHENTTRRKLRELMA